MSTNIKSVASFIKDPRRIEDLMKLYNSGQRRRYIIEKTIELSKCDYENFTTEFCVSRQFIEENMNLCHIDSNDMWHCILVKQYKNSGGVLVQSDGCEFAKYVAYFDGKIDK